MEDLLKSIGEYGLLAYVFYGILLLLVLAITMWLYSTCMLPKLLKNNPKKKIFGESNMSYLERSKVTDIGLLIEALGKSKYYPLIKSSPYLESIVLARMSEPYCSQLVKANIHLFGFEWLRDNAPDLYREYLSEIKQPSDVTPSFDLHIRGYDERDPIKGRFLHLVKNIPEAWFPIGSDGVIVWHKPGPHTSAWLTLENDKGVASIILDHVASFGISGRILTIGNHPNIQLDESITDEQLEGLRALVSRVAAYLASKSERDARMEAKYIPEPIKPCDDSNDLLTVAALIGLGVLIS